MHSTLGRVDLQAHRCHARKRMGGPKTLALIQADGHD